MNSIYNQQQIRMKNIQKMSNQISPENSIEDSKNNDGIQQHDDSFQKTNQHTPKDKFSKYKNTSEQESIYDQKQVNCENVTKECYRNSTENSGDNQQNNGWAQQCANNTLKIQSSQIKDSKFSDFQITFVQSDIRQATLEDVLNLIQNQYFEFSAQCEQKKAKVNNFLKSQLSYLNGEFQIFTTQTIEFYKLYYAIQDFYNKNDSNNNNFSNYKTKKTKIQSFIELLVCFYNNQKIKLSYNFEKSIKKLSVAEKIQQYLIFAGLFQNYYYHQVEIKYSKEKSLQAKDIILSLNTNITLSKDNIVILRQTEVNNQLIIDYYIQNIQQQYLFVVNHQFVSQRVCSLLNKFTLYQNLFFQKDCYLNNIRSCQYIQETPNYETYFIQLKNKSKSDDKYKQNLMQQEYFHCGISQQQSRNFIQNQNLNQHILLTKKAEEIEYFAHKNKTIQYEKLSNEQNKVKFQLIFQCEVSPNCAQKMFIKDNIEYFILEDIPFGIRPCKILLKKKIE